MHFSNFIRSQVWILEPDFCLLPPNLHAQLGINVILHGNRRVETLFPGSNELSSPMLLLLPAVVSQSLTDSTMRAP